ncbi:hypothetical protein ACIO6U_03715 [Streptomyces sp. NPDC087422]|uniref:phage tail tube protein n=1 Tax=Streptomyces sp. NPDC087422 TaxID=3365786 RepID=UPI003829BD70
MDLISDGNTKVCWATSLSSLTAPPVAELNAAADWTDRVTPDGLKTDPTTADVPTGSLASRQDTNTVGRVGWDVSLTCKKGTTLQELAPFNTLKYGVSGILIVRRGLPYEDAFATGQEIEIYPVICGERMNIAPEANSVAKFTSPMKLETPAVPDAVAA